MGVGLGIGAEVGIALGLALGRGVFFIVGAEVGTGVGTKGAAVGTNVGSWSGQSISSCILHLPLPVNCRTHPPPALAAAELSTVRAPRSRSWFSMTMYLVAVISASARTVRSRRNNQIIN